MKCPNCKRKFQPVAKPCLFNVDQYDKSATTLTKCCNAIIRVYPIRTYELAVEQGATVDDWGNEAV